MKLLDRYILKKLLGSFLFTVLIIVSVVLTFHMSDHTEKFVRAEVPASKIIDYYLDFIPWVTNSLTPITIFIATVFVTAQLAVRTEIVAMLSNGISFKRLLLPYLVGSLIIACMSFALTAWVIPPGNKARAEFEMKYFKKKPPYLENNIHLQVSDSTFLYLESFNSQTNTGYYFTMENIEGTELLEKLSADSIYWLPEQQKWRLDNWKVHTVGKPEEDMLSGLTVDSTLSILPEDFASSYKDHEGLTLEQLDQQIEKLRLQGSLNVIDYQIEKYVRFAAPFAILILCFMGVLISSKKSRGGTGYQIALGFLLCFIYIICFTFSKAVAETGGFNEIFGPAFSIWFPNILFLMISFFIYRYVPK